jgi:heme exporter protein D
MAFDFDAGVYAPYLWPALGLVAAALGALIFDTLARARKWKREADRLQAAKDARRQSQGQT